MCELSKQQRIRGVGEGWGGDLHDYDMCLNGEAVWGQL